MTQQYDALYHTYPIMSQDLGFEGSTKRFKTFPTPKDVFDIAMMGLPLVFPLTKEPITPQHVIPFLEAAVTEIEMSLNIDLTPVDHFQPFSYVDGMFESNFTGLKLERWPATKIVSMRLKFPHTQTTNPYQQYTIPAAWVSLSRNKVNVVAAYGAVSVETTNTEVATAGGLFSYITGFGRGSYQPMMIECVYTAGFPNDQLPTTVWDLIITLAAQRFLEGMQPVLFPFTSVNNQIDAVSQSAGYVGNLLVTRIEGLKKQYQDKVSAITRHFGRTIKMTIIGS